MELPCSRCQHLYTVNKQRPIPLLCLNYWSVLAYEPIKKIDASHALIVLIEAERLNTTELFLFTLAVTFVTLFCNFSLKKVMFVLSS